MNPARLSPEIRAAIKEAVASALIDYRKKGDIELQRLVIGGVTRDERLIMRSPNGQRWSIKVSNSGVLSATSI